MSSLTLIVKTSYSDDQVHIRLSFSTFIITIQPLCTFDFRIHAAEHYSVYHNKLPLLTKKYLKIRLLFTITDSKDMPHLIKTHVLNVYVFVDLTWTDIISYFLSLDLRAHKINASRTIQTTTFSAENNQESSSVKHVSL